MSSASLPVQLPPPLERPLLRAPEVDEWIRRCDAGAEAECWQVRAARQFRQRLGDSTFPCVFGKRASQAGSVWSGFVASPNSDAGREAFRGVVDGYVEQVLGASPVARLSMPLSVFTQPEPVVRELCFHHDVAWRALQHLHNQDPVPWPESVPTSPEHHLWTFCYRGLQLFVNISAPAHVQRKSRNLGDSLVFIINPRESFDVVAGACPSGRRVREVIRGRVTRYDGQKSSGRLGTYGDLDNFEWTQYAAEEGQWPQGARCPLRISRRKAGGRP